MDERFVVGKMIDLYTNYSEGGFLYKGSSIKFFMIGKLDIAIYMSSIFKLHSNRGKIAALKRLELHEKRKNILDGVQKNLDEKTLNKKNKRRL